ncbi:MAG: IS1595 family transposase [Anaerolineae bacterium]|nr:IS1595 family transposase [Anaerolineae bacterium]NIO00060.1 IS1595 family transposase [Anaerolineae bacterium]NIQ82843.1 IS1595 family transposase [Anaerolineae bacterium]
MEDYPRTLLEFEERFATEEACREYVAGIRWPEGFECPTCGGSETWTTRRGLYHCTHCGHQTSVLAGTIFQDTKKPLRLWFRAIWHLTSQKYGANALGLQRILGLGSYRTAWTWLHKLRVAMVRPGRERLSGLVEADETYLGGAKPGKRGRGASGKVLVLIMVEVKGSKMGRVRLKRVQDGSADSLHPAIKESVAPGTTLSTDDWNGYCGVEKLGYVREIVRQGTAVGENLLPRANRVAALLKRWLLGTYQGRVEASHLDYYLDEFTFRFNRRTSRSRGKLFYRVVQQAVAVGPVLGSEIRRGRP